MRASAVYLTALLLTICSCNIVMTFITSSTDFPTLNKPGNTEKRIKAKVKPKKIEGNSHSSGFNRKNSYTPEDVLNKLRRVNNLVDFVNLFRPKGTKIENIIKPHKPLEIDGLHGSKDLSRSRGKQDQATEGYEKRVVISYSSQETAETVRASFSARSASQPMGTGCAVRDFVYEIPVPSNSQIMYHPPCVTTKRCGGCCINYRFMKCEPAQIQYKNEPVFKFDFAVSKTPAPTVVPVAVHKTCKCGCIVKASDCAPNFDYSPHNCQCQCKRKEVGCPSGKQWTKRACGCTCSNVLQCSRLREWDEKTCSCICKRTVCPFGQTQDATSCRCIYLTGQTRSFGGGVSLEDNNNGGDVDGDVDDVPGKWIDFFKSFKGNKGK